MTAVLAVAAHSLVVLTLLVFLGAVLHKFFDLTEFQGFVADYQLLPDRLVKLATNALVVGEAGAVVLLLWPAGRAAGLSIAAGLLALYALAVGINIRRGRTEVECGCGGAPQRLSVYLVWRNLLLILLALLPLWRLPADLATSELLAALLAGLFLWLMLRFFDQIHANRQAFTGGRFQRTL